jgi:C4-dicarboxylate-specific signal transduction histidine kinase
MLMPKEFFQICWNIINNAKEILIERKTINPKIMIAIEESDSELIAHISDNAGGIKKEYINKICEPYFSTKEELNGKGLGLYISKSIVTKQLNGSFSVENGEDGAVFTIRIPKKTGKVSE